MGGWGRGVEGPARCLRGLWEGGGLIFFLGGRNVFQALPDQADSCNHLFMHSGKK